MKNYYLIHITFNFDCRGVFNIGIISNKLSSKDQDDLSSEMAWFILNSYTDAHQQLVDLGVLEEDSCDDIDIEEYEEYLMSYSIEEIKEEEFKKLESEGEFYNIEEL